MNVPELPISKLLILLILLMGPLRVVPAFAGVTLHLEVRERNRLARRGIVFASIAVLLAVFVGHPVLSAWGATPQALNAATGLLLLITSLQPLVGWPATTPPGAVPAGAMPAGTVPAGATPDLERLALSPLAFPIIVPPFAVGVLVLFSAFFHDLTSQLRMVGVAFALLLLDLLAMRAARRIMALIGPSSLQVLGAVFGVLQLALAMQMIFWAVHETFVKTPGAG